MPNTQVPVATYLDFEKIKVKYFGNLQTFMDNDPLVLHTISFRAVKSLATTKLPASIDDIKVPVMVFQGDEDSIFPVEYVTELYDQLTCKKKLEIFPGYNHAIMAEDPDAILPPIVEWLKEIHENHKPNPLYTIDHDHLKSEIYLDTTDAIEIDHSLLSFKKLLNANEFVIAEEMPAERGWKKQLMIRSNGFVSMLDMNTRFVDIESALNNPHIKIREHRKKALTEFKDSLSNIPNAVIKIHDLILIHTYDEDGKHIFVAIIENLRDKAVLRKRPELIYKPLELYNLLVKNHRRRDQLEAEKVG